jgi:rhodanese-related sulfurtransferase
MIRFIKNLLGLSPAVDYKALINDGAQIIDVRTPGEYTGGHIRGSVNIPLQNLKGNLNKIKKDRPVITCCATGMRSATAKGILKAAGYSEVHNGGSWMSLRNKIK